MITEAEGPTICYLQAREPGEATGVIQLTSEGWRIRNAGVWGQKMDVPTQAERANSLFLPLLFSSGPRVWIGWCPPALVRASAFFSLQIQIYFQKYPQTHPEIMANQLSRHRLAQSSRRIKLTISVDDVFIVFNMRMLAEEGGFPFRKWASLSCEVPV